MRREALACSLFLTLAAAEGAANDSGEVELIVAGPPIEAQETSDNSIYLEPSVPPQFEGNPSVAGILTQGWSMLGREDRGFAAGSDEYRARPCEPLNGAPVGEEAVLDAIVDQARNTSILIVNESHEVTLHRQFSERILERVRPLGFTVFAAETFQNRKGDPDPVEESKSLTYPRQKDGYYLKEPVFGDLVRTAKRLDYRLAAYEQPYDPARERPKDRWTQIAMREQSQAENLAALLETMGPDEKLVVHVGYAHAREIETKRADGLDTTWMAGRLKRMTGIDPLTIAQTECRGSGETVRLSAAPERISGWFDMIVDHPAASFRHGRASWRFTEGRLPVDIPAQFASTDQTLIIEAFVEGEPFEAVPVDRVWVEPGEDVKLSLKPGRYVVRAVHPVVLPPADRPTKPGSRSQGRAGSRP